MKTAFSRKYQKKGFTLIEVIVASSLFITVVTISTGALISIISANSKAQSVTSVMHNINFALEDLSRRARVGTEYQCDGSKDDCIAGSTFSFKYSDVSRYLYKLGSGANANQIVQKIGDNGAETPITAAEVSVQSLRFVVSGMYPKISTTGGLTDQVQPRMFIVLKGKAGDKPGQQTDFVIQTSITKRGLDEII